MPAPAKYTLSDDLGFDIILKVARVGDRVSYTDRFDTTHTGRVQMTPALSGHQHLVLNMGGAHGTPAVVNVNNFAALSPAVDRRAEVAEQVRALQADRPAAPVVAVAPARARPKA